MSTENISDKNNLFGSALKRFRKGKNLTLSAMADDLGTSQGYLSEVERGVKMPGTDLLLSLKRVYELNLNDLFDGNISFEKNVPLEDINHAAEPSTTIYNVKSQSDRIKALDIDPEEKLNLLITLIDILEERGAKNE